MAARADIIHPPFGNDKPLSLNAQERFFGERGHGTADERGT
jgi:hypothetical protein